MPLVKVYRRQRKSDRHYLDDSSYESESSHRNRDHSTSQRRHGSGYVSKHHHSSRQERFSSSRPHYEDSHRHGHAHDSHHSHHTPKRLVTFRDSTYHSDEDYSGTPQRRFQRINTQPPRSGTSSQNRTPERIKPVAVSSRYSSRHDPDDSDPRRACASYTRGTSLSRHSRRQPLRARRNASDPASADVLDRKRHATDSPVRQSGSLQCSQRSQRHTSSREPIAEVIDSSHHRRQNFQTPHHSARDTQGGSHMHRASTRRTAHSESPLHRHSSKSRGSASRHTHHLRSRTHSHHLQPSPRRSHRDPYQRDVEAKPRYILVYTSLDEHFNTDAYESGHPRHTIDPRSSQKGVPHGGAYFPARRDDAYGAHATPMVAPNGVFYSSLAPTQPRFGPSGRDAILGWPHPQSFEGRYSAGRTLAGYGAMGVRREWAPLSTGRQVAPEDARRDPPSGIPTQGKINRPGPSSELIFLRNPETQRTIEEAKRWLEGMKHEMGVGAMGSPHGGRQRDSARPTDFDHPLLEEELPGLWKPERSEASSIDDIHRRFEQELKAVVSSTHKERGTAAATASSSHHEGRDDRLVRKPVLMQSQASSSADSSSTEGRGGSIEWEEVEPVAVDAPLLPNSQKSESPKRTCAASLQKRTTKEYSPGLQPVMDSTLLNDTIFSFSSFMDGKTFGTTTALCEYNVRLAEALSDEHLDLIREVVFKNDESAFAELLYGDDILYKLNLINAILHNINDMQVKSDMRTLSTKVLKQFNRKCRRAQKAIMHTGSELPRVIQRAASNLEREMPHRVENTSLKKKTDGIE